MVGSKARIIIFRIIIEPHLLISFLYAVLGTLVALRQGFYSAPLFVITVVGAVSSQIAANTFDEYFDHKLGTDLLTTKTAYSGGGRIVFEGGAGTVRRLQGRCGSTHTFFFHRNLSLSEERMGAHSFILSGRICRNILLNRMAEKRAW